MNENMFYQAVAMARAGRKADARSLLYKVLTANHANELAWLWYAECAASTEERIGDLEYALRLHPTMYRVRAGLSAIRRGRYFDPGRTQPVFVGASEGPAGAEPPETITAANPEDEWVLSAASSVFTVSPDQISVEEFEAIESRAAALLLNRPLLRQERPEDPWTSLTAVPVKSSPRPRVQEGPPLIDAKTITALGLMLGFVFLVGMFMLAAG